MDRIALSGLIAIAGCAGGSYEPPRRYGPPGGPSAFGDAGARRDAGASPAACVHEGPPVLDPSTLDPCPSCGGGHCLPSALVPEESRGRLGSCDAERLCVPDLFIETGGDFLLATCVSVGGAEGRCASTCLPDVAARMGSLPSAGCAPDERCAPCFDPLSGADTGVCRLACDTGPRSTDPPLPPMTCCGGAGTCLDASAVPAEDRERLGPDTCAGTTMLCVPTAFADDAFRPASCRSIGGGEGRCLPECLPSVAEDAERLPAAGCGTGERCVPCYQPTDGSATGACAINGDAPAEPAFVFERCCEHDDRDGVFLGTCVPRESVPADRRGDLEEQECPEDMGLLCVPTANVEDPDRRNPPCTTEGGTFSGPPGPGACVLECMVGFRAVFLGRSTCGDEEVCAPCIDPTSGEPSGACD